MANLFEVAVLVDAEAFEVLKESSAGRIEPARQMHSRATLATDAPASLGDPLKGRQRVRFHGYRHGQGSASSAVKHAVLLPVAQSHIHHNVRHGRRTTGIQRTTDVQKGTHHAGQQGGHITSDNRYYPYEPRRHDSRHHHRHHRAQVAVDQRRVSAAVSALAPNTRKAYGSAWSAWQRWALDQGRPVLPATAADVADYLEARHAAGASPATIRLARAAVAKVHQVSGAADPTADGLVTDVLKRIGRDGRDRGRGQVAGIGWSAAEAAASIASNGGDSLAGLRDGALLRVMSDGLLRISEASALQVSDVEATADGGTVTIRASKTDQQGDGAVRFLGTPTVAAVQPLPRCGRHHRRSPVPADPQGRPGHRRLSGRRLDPGDRPQARGGRRRDRRADRRPLAPGRLGARARRRWRVPGRAPAGGRVALAHHAGGLRQARVRHPWPGRSPTVRGGAVGERGHRVSVPVV